MPFNEPRWCNMRCAQKLTRWIAVIGGLTLSEYAGAAELTGAWAPDADKCNRVFMRRGRAGQIDYVRSAGRSPVDADELRGVARRTTRRAVAVGAAAGVAMQPRRVACR
jgi:hypothetical protein